MRRNEFRSIDRHRKRRFVNNDWFRSTQRALAGMKLPRKLEKDWAKSLFSHEPNENTPKVTQNVFTFAEVLTGNKNLAFMRTHSPKVPNGLQFLCKNLPVRRATRSTKTMMRSHFENVIENMAKSGDNLRRRYTPSSACTRRVSKNETKAVDRKKLCDIIVYRNGPATDNGRTTNSGRKYVIFLYESVAVRCSPLW